MSEDDFLRWALTNQVRAEWVEGEVIVMAPGNINHQDLMGWLYRLLADFVEQRDLGKAILYCFTRMSKPRPQIRVPDVLFIEKGRLAELVKSGQPVQGSPDLVMEIVSADSAARDWRENYAVYQAAGVREYWIIDPANRIVEAYQLDAGGYRKIDQRDGSITSVVVPGWYLRPQWLWQQPRPLVLDLLAELGVRN